MFQGFLFRINTLPRRTNIPGNLGPSWTAASLRRTNCILPVQGTGRNAVILNTETLTLEETVLN